MPKPRRAAYNTSSLDIHEFGDFSQFAQNHAENWRLLCAASPRATVFQTWEWVSAWWKFNRQNKRFLGIVFSENGQTIGFAALYFDKGSPVFRTARFVGNGGSDYLDLLALPGFEGVVSAAFAGFLWENRRRWDWVDLQQVKPEGVAAGMTQTQNAGRLKAAFWQGETCPYLPLPADWETFRKGLKKKLRSNVGYYERALEKQYVVEYRVADAKTLADDLDAFFNLHQRRWNKRWLPGAFASRRARKWHEAAAQNLLQAGMLRLHTLALDGQTEAALYCFQKGAVCSYYLGGFEPTLARLSLGTVLTARAIRHAIEADGAAEFDFLRGNEPYKYKWGALDRYNRRVSITHFGLRPALLASGGKIGLSVEEKLKNWMHKKHGGGSE